MRGARGWHWMAGMSGVAGAIVASSACYTYRPLVETTPPPGREVRATLATPTNLRIGELTLHDVDRVDGLIYSASADSLLVSGVWVYTQVGSRYAAQGGVFPLERPTLRSLEVRSFSARRTGLVTAVTAVLGFALFRVVDRVLGGSGPTPPGPDPN